AAEKAAKAPKAVKTPDRWEATIKKFEADDKAQPPAKGGLLLVGGSNARRWTDVSDYFPGEKVLNRGFGGAQLGEVVHFLDRIVLPYAPRAIFVNAGGNDLGSGKTPEDVAASYRAFMARIKKELPKTRVYAIGVPPVMRTVGSPESLAGIKKTNDLIAEVARADDQLEFIDLFPQFIGADGKPRAELYVADGTHFTPQGYAIVSGLLKEKMKAAGK
ncbi:MAG: GDSL-type esterase/lipase family protein, partial [Verrucomicrobiota bacterium]